MQITFRGRMYPHKHPHVLARTLPQAKRGVRLIGDLSPGLPPILGDTGRIIQIFHNLIGNSCKVRILLEEFVWGTHEEVD